MLVPVVLATAATCRSQETTAEYWPLATLNERQRVAVVLNKFEDMNYAEIAAVMGLSTKAVKSLLSRARGKLREVLQAYVYMDGTAPPVAPPGDN